MGKTMTEDLCCHVLISSQLYLHPFILQRSSADVSTLKAWLNSTNQLPMNTNRKKCNSALNTHNDECSQKHLCLELCGCTFVALRSLMCEMAAESF